jgi:hypothetical protein
MSFWNLSDGNTATDTGTDFETGGGKMEPIPAGTRCNAMIDDASWSEYNGHRFVNLRWTILAPDEYKNRKVFQKVRVYDPDQKKGDKAKRMLAAIDANCGGKLMKVDGEPTDSDLQACLMSRPMHIELQVWEMTGDDGQERSGNWISAVSGSPKQSAPAKPKPQAQQAPQPQSDEDEDIPF